MIIYFVKIEVFEQKNNLNIFLINEYCRIFAGKFETTKGI